MTEQSLNELWCRILETCATGLCYAALAAWFVRLASAAGVATRYVLYVYGVCCSVCSVASLATSWSIYYQRPIVIAWFQAPSAIAKVTIVCLALSATPKILFMLRMWADVLLKAPNDFADQTVHRVRVRPWRGVTSRFRRRKEAVDGAPCP